MVISFYLLAIIKYSLNMDEVYSYDDLNQKKYAELLLIYKVYFPRARRMKVSLFYSYRL